MKKITFILFIIALFLLSGCSSTSKIKDCEDDFNCFILASETCENSIVNHVTEANFFGLLTINTDYDYELNLDENNECNFKFIINNVDLIFPDSYFDQLKASGLTQEQIDEQIIKSKEQYNTYNDKEGICKGDTLKINEMLKRWDEGSYSSEDYNNLDCSGPYFDAIKDLGNSLNAQGSVEVDNNTTSVSFGFGEKDERSCWKNEDCEEGFSCIDKQCLNPSNVEECKQFEGSFFGKENCVKHVAIKNNDATICKEMNIKDNTYNSVEINCYSELAILNNDDTICQIFVDSKPDTVPFRFQCYLDYALEKSSPSTCEKISSEITKDKCLKSIEN